MDKPPICLTHGDEKEILCPFCYPPAEPDSVERAKAFLYWMLGPTAEIPEVYVLKLAATFDAVKRES